MARRAQIIGRATDYAGVLWDVRERRPTVHGFDVLIGWPQGEPRGQGGRGVATILSAELARYLTELQPRPRDLDSLTLEAFCALHGCSIGAASQRRTAMRHHGV